MTIQHKAVEVQRRASITCDRCGAVARFTGHGSEMCDAFDFLSFKDTGGFGSVHMDGQRWSIDLCGPCTIEVLGHYIQKEKRHD